MELKQHNNRNKVGQSNVVAVVCAYNEARHIVKVVQGLLKFGLKVLVVDDGSTDFTGNRAQEAGATVIRHDKNKGKGQAIRTGVSWVLEHGYDAALLLDGDGQHLPDEAPRFLFEFERTRADLIVGNRMWNPRTMPLIRVVSNSISSSVISLLAGRRVRDSQSGYRLVSRPLLKFLLSLPGDRFVLESEMIVDALQQGFKYSEVPITCVYSTEKSHYHPLKDSAEFVVFAVRKGLDVLKHKLNPR